MSLQTARSLLTSKLQTAAQEFDTYLTLNNLYQDNTVKYTNYYIKCINDLLKTLKDDEVVEVSRVCTKTFAIKCGTFSSELITYSDESTTADLDITFGDNMGGAGITVNDPVFHMLNNINTLDDLTEEQREMLHNKLCYIVDEEQI